MANSSDTPQDGPNITKILSDRPNLPLDFSHHFSRVTKARQESKIKEFYKYFLIPGIGNLAGGKYTFNSHRLCFSFLLLDLDCMDYITGNTLAR